MKIEAVYRTIWRVTYPYFTYLMVSVILMQTGTGNVLLFSLLSGLLTLPFLCVFYYKDKRCTVNMKKAHSFKVLPLYNYIYIVFMGMAACLALNYMIDIIRLADFSTTYRSTYGMFEESGLIISMLASGIIAPLVEELLYRGLIYKRLRENFHPVISAVISAFIFGLAHGNLVQFFYAFFAGLMMAYVYEKYQNFLAPLLFHFSANALSLAIMWSDGLKAGSGVKPILFVLNVIILFVIYRLIEKNVKREVILPVTDEQGAI